MPIEHLPARLRAPAERLRAFLMTDATVLMIIGGECAVRGLSYLSSPPPAHPAERFFPLTVWAVIWVAVGVGCAASAAAYRSAAAGLLLSAAVGLNALWAGSLATSALTAHGPTNWGGAGIYAAVALLALWAVWRGSRTEIRVQEVGGGH